MKRPARNGSALVTVIWVIAVLSLIVLNFAVEARLQSNINRYTSERVRVNSLTDAGKVIAEVLLTGYKTVADAPEDQTLSDMEEEFQEDRWITEKRSLKSSSSVDTGAIAVDPDNPDSGTVTVRIKAMETKFNINKLWSGGDPNWLELWENILAKCNVPEEYWNDVVCSWNDWRDTDNAVSKDLIGEVESGEGGEAEFYRDELRSEDGTREFEPCKPRNGEIPDLKELAMLRAFREHPEILTGGVINPDAREKDQIKVSSILKYFGVMGSGKININTADADMIAVIPGICDDIDAYSSTGDEEDIVNAILEYRDTPDAAAQDQAFFKDEDYGSFKDWNDLQNRIQDKIGKTIGNEASNYLVFQAQDYFEITITGVSAGISHVVKAVAMVEDSKIRYLRWQEDP